MAEKITRELFDSFVQVAEVELTPEEADSIFQQMQDQMEIIAELESIPLNKDLPPVIHGNPYPLEIQTTLREDVWKPYPDTAAILAQVPHTKDGYIISPDVPHQKIG